MSLNKQTPHFLRPETKRYGFQDLDGQTDTKTVPKTCEVNETISKRRTHTHTHTPCCNYIIDFSTLKILN
jgi:hypothetical protein